jgi:O-antigen/teichoic acid export membrane protein
VLKNLISSFFTRGGIALLNLFILLLSTRQLGSDIVGQLSLLILNIAIVQIINEIYTGYALVHYVPKTNTRKLYQTGLVWTLLCTSLLNLVFLVISFVWPGSGIRELWLHGLVLSFAISLHSFHCVILLAKEKISAYNFLMLFQPLATFTVLFIQVVVLNNKSVTAYIIALYISYCSSALLSLIFLLRTLAHEQHGRPSISTISILRNGLINQLGNLAHTLSNRYNYYMISVTTLVGVYASATSLIESVWIIGGSIAPVILSHVANARNPQHNSRLTFLLCKISFLLSLACVGIIVLLPEGFFAALLGRDFTNTKSIMLHLSPGVLCISFSTVISHYFSGLGQQKVQFIANGLGLLTTICTSYFLISRYQLIGACYAASLSYFTAALVLVVVFMKQNGFGWKDLLSMQKDLSLFKKEL